MCRVVIVLVTLFALTVEANSGDTHKTISKLVGRIVGGEDANIRDLPYQLSLESWGFHTCGATIISPDWALTAAHCVETSQPVSITVRAGSNTRGAGGSLHHASRIIVHPQYNAKIIDYDFGLVQVVEAFPLGRPGVQAIRLTNVEPAGGDVATVSGWGKRDINGPSSIQLQRVDVPIVDHMTCQELYSDGWNITARMICAGLPEGGKDSCQGDSGGPLASGNVLVGIVSWGVGCAWVNTPGVYSNIADQRAWIRENSGV